VYKCSYLLTYLLNDYPAIAVLLLFALIRHCHPCSGNPLEGQMMSGRLAINHHAVRLTNVLEGPVGYTRRPLGNSVKPLLRRVDGRRRLANKNLRPATEGQFCIETAFIFSS